MDSNKPAILLLLVLFSSPMLNGQQFELGLNILPGLAHSKGFEPGMNGLDLEVAYVHPLEPAGSIKGAICAGYTGWGAQTLLATGYRTRGRNAIEAMLINGMALYRHQPAWVGGVQASWVGSLFPGGKNELGISAGMRFSMQPAYRDTGPLWYYLDLPLRISWIRHRQP